MFIAACLPSESICHAFPIQESNDDYFFGWTDEEYAIYEDSIKSALYPPVITYLSDGSDLKTESNHQKTSTSSDEATQHIPNSVEIDKTKEVGQIQINSEISATGAKTYEVPLDVYPGIRGMEPHLALVYDSQQGNSIVGMGWRLSGLSYITRGGKNIYHDGTSDGIRMNNNDSFWLDGKRLICTGLSSGQIMFESEQGNIKAKGYVTDNVMKYFEVFYPEGYKAVFGFKTTQENGLVYPISEYSDLQGNKISYSYTYSDSHFNISKIYYNGAVIEFKYANRLDPILSYIGGYRVYESLLLKEITCKLAGTEISTYSLEHSSGLLSSFLEKIQHSSESKSFNPITLYYGEGLTGYPYDETETMLMSGYESSDTKMIKAVKGKFDYNSGSEGIAVLPNLNPYWKHHRHGTVFRNTQDRFDNLFTGDENIYLYTGLTGDIVSPTPNLKTGKCFVDILCADLEGKQEESLIKVNNVVADNKDEITFTVYGCGFTGSIKQRYTRTFKFPTAYKDGDGAWSIQPKFYYAGDFDGDGKMEILAASTHQPFGDTGKPSICYVFDLNTGVLKFSSHIFPYNVDFIGTQQSDANAAFNNSDRLLAMDCDGDGKTDICIINDEGTSIYTFDISGSTYSPRKIYTYTYLTKTRIANRDLLPCDFNGDGLPDFLLSPVSGTGGGDKWTVLYSTGNGFFIECDFNCTTKSDDDKEGFIVQDVNGDGKSDLIKYNNSGLNPGFRTYLSRNGSLYYLGYTSYSDSGTIMVPTYINTHNCFMNLLCLQKGNIKKFSFARNDMRESSLTGMANSLGIVEKNEYQYIDGRDISSSLYTPGYDAVYPYVNLMEPISVLASTETYVGGNRIEVKTFKYSNAVLHRQGKGFCGFEKITSYDRLGRMSAKQYAPYKFGVLIKEDTPNSEHTYSYDISTNSLGITKINLAEKKDKDLLTGISSTTTSTYDSYGYPKEQTTLYSDGLSVKNKYDYASQTTVADGYNLGFLIDQTTTTTRSGSTFTERMYIPARSARLPSVKVLYKNGNQTLQTSFSYDSKGNTLSESEKPYTAVSLQKTSYSYDSYGRITKTTDPTGFSNSYIYDTKGRVKSLIDRRGQTTQFVYDPFGRELSVTNPDGTKKEYEYVWSSGTDNSIYYTIEKNTGKPTTKHYYDALNREIRTVEVRFDGSETRIDKQYDPDGNLTAESLPYKGESPQFWNLYEYDYNGRKTSCHEASGKVITYQYDGNTVSTTENGKTATRIYDSQGNLTSLTDQAGTVEYEFEADGQLSSLTAFEDITTTICYDKYRRKTSVEDPSLGTFLYSYDASGNIASETDANGLQTIYEYDSFNRLIKKTSPEFTSSYSYNSFGDIASVSSNNGSSSVYEYDDFGRLTKSTEYGLDDKWLQKEYSYAEGNINTITYTTQSGVEEKEIRTYSKGFLKSVKSKDGTVIFSLKKENSFGQPTEVSTSYLTREYSYSNFGLPTRRKAISSSKTYQDISYNFDGSSSFLLSKTDNLSGLTESFSYDSLDRLTDYGDSEVTYDSKGNILSKTGIGSFEYDLSSKPYAITEAHLTGDVMSSDSQSIQYTSFARPSHISEGSITADFSYNADYDRIRMIVSKNGKPIVTRHYLGNCYEYEKSDVAVTERLYLLGDYYSSPVVLEKTRLIGAIRDSLITVGDEALSDVNSVIGGQVEPVRYNDLYYILRDYNGSITGVLSYSGGIVQKLDYDAWGRLRDPSTNVAYTQDQTPSLYLGRGYTGHEYLHWFGLINMNARLYDPVLSRFLSPDPFVQMPDWSQNLNRFTYAMNNPLCYVDQDGQFFWFIVGAAAVIGGVSNLIIHWDHIKASGSGWNGFWRGAGYFLAGAVAGGVGAAVGVGVTAGFGSMLAITAGEFATLTTGFLPGAYFGAASGAANGFLLHTTNSLIEGESLGTALDKGIFGAAKDGIAGGLLGGVSGSIQALSNGKNIWSGKTLGEYTGYYGLDDTTVRYVGITKRNPEVRFKEHLLSNTNRSNLHYRPKKKHMTLIQARIWEQTNIIKYGLMKNGGLLYNLRNEIAPSKWLQFGIKFNY